jgi:hypothetical protein
MRKLFVASAIIGIVFLLVVLDAFKLEVSRVDNLCKSTHLHLATAHDAIDALRNYQVPSNSGPVGKVLSRVRHLDAFRRDGYSVARTGEIGLRQTTGGGWNVKEWTEPLITRGYTVDFYYYDVDEFQPAIEVKCDVLECGAIDASNCQTFGGYY